MFNILRTNTSSTTPTVKDIANGVAQKRVVLIDVREVSEVQTTGKAKGALHIPLGVLLLKADPTAPDAQVRPGLPVAVYCASGGRSGKAAQMLERMGYDPVWNIGGLADWKAGGGQVERN